MGIIPRYFTVKVSELLSSELAIFHDEGLKLHLEVMKIFWDKYQEATIFVDFDGIDRCSYAFLNASIGKIIIEHRDVYFEHKNYGVVIKNANEATARKIKEVIINAKNTRTTIKPT